MRAALTLSVVLTACGPDLGLDELSAHSLVFEGEQSESGQVRGVVGFLSDSVTPALRTNHRCRMLGDRISATLANGRRLARTSGKCGPGEFEERFLIPEGATDGDLNIVLSDGARVSRVVVPDALRPLRVESEELALRADEFTPIPLGLRRGDLLFEISAAFVDQAGTQRWWKVQDFYSGTRGIRVGPGEPPLSGRLVLGGRVIREALVCRDFAGCKSETQFLVSVPARY